MPCGHYVVAYAVKLRSIKNLLAGNVAYAVEFGEDGLNHFGLFYPVYIPLW